MKLQTDTDRMENNVQSNAVTSLSMENQIILQRELISQLKKVPTFLDNGIVSDFDSNASCLNICITYPLGSEVKLFLPNSTQENIEEELFSQHCAVFEDHMGNDTYEFFESSIDMVGYLVKNIDNL